MSPPLRFQDGIFLTIVACILEGCATSPRQAIRSGPYTPTRFETVETLSQEPNRPYEVIAFVQAEAILEKPEALVKKCLEQAVEVGADAVVFTQAGEWRDSPVTPGAPGVVIEKPPSRWTVPRRAAGRAIKWKP